MTRALSRAALALLVFALAAVSARAQTVSTVEVSRHAVIMDAPRSDGVVVGSVEAGTVLAVMTQFGRWYQVNAPSGATWRRGWIEVHYLVVAGSATPSPNAGADRTQARPALHIRGFGEVGGALFTAQKSFEAILGSGAGTTSGFGGEIVLPSGLFARVSVERFAKTGTRAVVSGSEVFRLTTPDSVTLTPIGATVGYREVNSHWNRLAGYVGVGGGWLLFKERSSSSAQDVNKGHIEYHVIGGAEFMVAPGLWAAGELRWRSAPDALGPTGIGAALGESNLGATSFVFKIFVGR